MATSDIILRRLREEQAQNQWNKGRAWESTPTPTPTPRPPTPGPTITPTPTRATGTNRRTPTPQAPTPVATPTPRPTRDARPTPTVTPQPNMSTAAVDYMRSVNAPMPNNQRFDPYTAPTPTPRPSAYNPTPIKVDDPISTQPVNPQRLPYQTYIPDYRTAQPMSQMPQNRPVQGPPTQAEAMQRQAGVDPRTGMQMRGNGGIGTVLDRGGGFRPATAQRAPAMGAEDVLLKYLQESGEPELLARLNALIAEPAWTEGEQQMNISDGYAPGYQGMEYRTMGGRQNLVDILSRYYAGQPTTALKPNSWGRQ